MHKDEIEGRSTGAGSAESAESGVTDASRASNCGLEIDEEECIESLTAEVLSEELNLMGAEKVRTMLRVASRYLAFTFKQTGKIPEQLLQELELH